VLTSELAEALTTDFDEAMAFGGQIAGLDFDPFVAAQDPCDEYTVRRVVESPSGFDVEVQGDCTGLDQPDIIANVISANEGYRFSNFRYPGSGTDLMSVLERLRDSRR